jgi:hypothetical protein
MHFSSVYRTNKEEAGAIVARAELFIPSHCSFGLSATSQQYFSLRTNQPPATSQLYFYLTTNQHQQPATSQTNSGVRRATRSLWRTGLRRERREA